MTFSIAAALLFSLLSVACTSAPASAPPRVPLRLANAQPGSFAEQLAEHYSRRSSTLHVTIVPGILDPFRALGHGQADITLAPADSPYFAYRRTVQSGAANPVRALATLQVVPIHMLVRAGLPIQEAEHLRGHPVGMAGTSPMGDLVTRAVGLTEVVQAASGADGLAEGALDALLITGYYPASPVEAAMRRGARLISIAGPTIDRLRQEYPFIRLVTIPAYTYPAQTTPVYTVGAEVIYLCRSDLPEAVVYELTRRLFEALPTLAKNFSAMRALDVTHAAATVIPLHDGAARYYREVELLQ